MLSKIVPPCQEFTRTYAAEAGIGSLKKERAESEGRGGEGREFGISLQSGRMFGSSLSRERELHVYFKSIIL